MSDLKAYLAEKYMSGPKADAILQHAAPKKKKKKRKGEDITPLERHSFINDDDSGWGLDSAKDEDEDLADAVVAADRSFKKRKVAASDASNWVAIQGSEIPAEEEPIPTDEQPMVVDTEEKESFQGGLVTASKLRKMMPTNQAPTTETATAEEIAQAQETVYRDSSGKRIDTKAQRAAAARAKREREEKEAQKMEWGKGLVQREEEAKRRSELEKQRGKPFARHADDKELNEEQRSKELWNDPAAAFLTKKKTKGPRKPEYSGPPPPPNRFGIKPGYRWDGVDRSNGFEKKLFQSLNAQKRRGQESYSWSVDDM